MNAVQPRPLFILEFIQGNMQKLKLKSIIKYSEISLKSYPLNSPFLFILLGHKY